MEQEKMLHRVKHLMTDLNTLALLALQYGMSFTVEIGYLHTSYEYFVYVSLYYQSKYRAFKFLMSQDQKITLRMLQDLERTIREKF